MAVDVLSVMRQQKQAAENKSNGNNFLFFKLGDKQRASIHPLCDLSSVDYVHFHHFFDQMSNRYTDAVCASADGKPCLHCENGKHAETKRVQLALKSKQMFMVPAWVHAIQQKRIDADTQTEILDENDNPIWDYVTYKDENGKDVMVGGLRIMTLAFVGSAWSSVLDVFFKMHEAGTPITSSDFIVERQGGDMTTKYVTSKRKPVAIKADLTKMPVTQKSIRDRVLQAAPIALAGAGNATKTGDPAIDTFVQAVKNSQSATEVEEDEVPVF